MSKYLTLAEDPNPPTRSPRHSDPHEELARAERDYDAYLDHYELRNPIEGPMSRWDVSSDQYVRARVRLDAARRAVERLGRSGELPVVELGDTRKNQRVREADLEKFIEDRTYGVHPT